MSVDDIIQSKLRKAEEFLTMAEVVADSGFDAAISLAASAGINASDVILLATTGSSSREVHDRAVVALERADFRNAARQLARLLGMKNVAQYSSRRTTRREAESAVQAATRLVSAARSQVDGASR